jgi:uncharacterized membrane protein YhfC
MFVGPFLVRLCAGSAILALVVSLGVFLRRRVYSSLSPFWWGALCFVLSQVAHVPFNLFLLNPFMASCGWTDLPHLRGFPLVATSCLLGLSAGLFEETSRWILYRYKVTAVSQHEKSYKLALMVGAGHGGCEAALVGISSILALVGMTFLRLNPQAIDDMPAEQKELWEEQLKAYWNMSGLLVAMAPIERVIAMSFHLSASVLVCRGFGTPTTNGGGLSSPPYAWRYYWMAVAFHAALDAVAVYLMFASSAYAVEGVLAITALPLSIYIIRYFAREQEQMGSASNATYTQVMSIDETADGLLLTAAEEADEIDEETAVVEESRLPIATE